MMPALLRRPWGVIVVGVLVGSLPGALGAQPDLRQMAGVPLPTADLADGTVSVRVVRGDLSRPVGGQAVELEAGPETREAVTDAEGRATFAGVVGAGVRAVAVVDGERLASEPFDLPPQGGVRLLLVAGLGEAAAAAPPPAQPGEITISDESRFVVELAEGSLEVFSALELVNEAAEPVEPPAPLVFELPEDALHATVLEGSTSQARAEGGRVHVAGPFMPGRTPLQFAYRLPYDGSRATVEQQLPTALGRLNVAVRRVDGLQIAVAGAPDQRETTFNGRTYAIAGGPGLPRGGTIRIDLEGLPHHPRWPLYLTFGLAAGLLLAAAVLAAAAAGRDEAIDLGELEGRRHELLDALARIEREHREGALDAAAYRAGREPLVAALEPIYEQLDRLRAGRNAPRADGTASALGSKTARPDPIARA